jgi:hypothetical protein
LGKTLDFPESHLLPSIICLILSALPASQAGNDVDWHTPGFRKYHEEPHKLKMYYDDARKGMI